MPKILKSGKVVIVLSGRQAGKKAIVVSVFGPNKKRPFPHVLVAGLEKSPKRVTKTMTKRTILRKSHVKVFVKFINVSHVMPTRYSVTDANLVKIAPASKVDSKVKKAAIVDNVQKALFSKYLDAKPKAPDSVKFFFQKLRF